MAWMSNYNHKTWVQLLIHSPITADLVVQELLGVLVSLLPVSHGDVIKWKHFPRYWPFVRGIHRSAVNSPHKGQWRGALMFSLISAWKNGRVNNREAGDVRRHRTHYDVTVMSDYIQIGRRVITILRESTIERVFSRWEFSIPQQNWSQGIMHTQWGLMRFIVVGREMKWIVHLLLLVIRWCHD